MKGVAQMRIDQSLKDSADKVIVNPPTLTKPSGYSHAIIAPRGRMLFLAGQTGSGKDGQISAPDDMVAQFTQALANIKTVVEAAGGRLEDIVKLTIFVTDKVAYRANLEPLGGVYRSFFGRYYPAMTLVEVKCLFDDKAQIEIEGIAVLA